MSDNNLIKKAEKIRKKLNIDIKQLHKLGLKIEEGESRNKYRINSVAGSPIKLRHLFSSHRSKVQKINLYVHLPFCVYKCTFCGFYSLTEQSKTIIDRYISALKKELELLLKTFSLEDAIVTSIYFGGGTPTYLSAKQLKELIVYLRSKLNIIPNVNFTCEANPENLVGSAGEDKVQTLLENGVNRLSIGIQTFDNGILKLIGRGCSSQTAISAYNNAYEAGFRNINIDLMFGLPNQTLKKWEHDLDMIASLRPGWADLYQLSIQGPVIHRTFTEKFNRFPNEEIILLMKIMAFEKLTELGYKQIHAPDRFVLPSKYKHTPPLPREILGLGASARSDFNGVRYNNYPDLKRYNMMLVNKGQLPISFATKHSKRQLIERETIFKLRQSGLDRRDFKAEFGIDVENVFGDVLQKLEKLEMITKDGDLIKLSYKGMLFADEVFKQFSSRAYFERFKTMLLNKNILKMLYLKKRYSKYYEKLLLIRKLMP
jgi:oxygen-independent coproporphyrinogen-3 oxidase